MKGKVKQDGEGESLSPRWNARLSSVLGKVISHRVIQKMQRDMNVLASLCVEARGRPLVPSSSRNGGHRSQRTLNEQRERTNFGRHGLDSDQKSCDEQRRG